MSSVTRRHARSRRRRRVPRALAAAIPLSLVAIEAHAQTDYYNTDAGRPISVEDAYPIERRAFELQLAPLRLERARGGAYTWGIEPELAFGILPRTQVEIGFPLAYVDAGADRRTAGLTGIELAALHNLNVETSIPALAVAGEVLLPVGSLNANDPYFSVKGIATKTFTWARFHLNGTYTLGERDRSRPGNVPPPGGEPVFDANEDLSRWTAGLAVDRTFPLRSLLVTAEIVAREPYIRYGDDDPEPAWETAAGARYQLSPRVVLDGGAGYRLTGDGEWFATFGAAVSVGLPWRP